MNDRRIKKTEKQHTNLLRNGPEVRMCSLLVGFLSIKLFLYGKVSCHDCKGEEKIKYHFALDISMLSAQLVKSSSTSFCLLFELPKFIPQNLDSLLQFVFR